MSNQSSKPREWKIYGIKERLTGDRGFLIEMKVESGPQLSNFEPDVKDNLFVVRTPAVKVIEYSAFDAQAQELASLRAENERLLRDWSTEAWERDSLKAEVERLRGVAGKYFLRAEQNEARCDRYRTALELRTTEEYYWAEKPKPEGYCFGHLKSWARLAEEAKQALADAPQVDNNVDNEVYNGPSKDEVIEILNKTLDAIDWHIRELQSQKALTMKQMVAALKVISDGLKPLEAAKGTV